MSSVRRKGHVDARAPSGASCGVRPHDTNAPAIPATLAPEIWTSYFPGVHTVRLRPPLLQGAPTMTQRPAVSPRSRRSTPAASVSSYFCMPCWPSSRPPSRPTISRWTLGHGDPNGTVIPYRRPVRKDRLCFILRPLSVGTSSTALSGSGQTDREYLSRFPAGSCGIDGILSVGHPGRPIYFCSIRRGFVAQIQPRVPGPFIFSTAYALALHERDDFSATWGRQRVTLAEPTAFGFLAQTGPITSGQHTPGAFGRRLFRCSGDRGWSGAA